jgi:DNA-binding MarR family transcriptional regulator
MSRLSYPVYRHETSRSMASWLGARQRSPRSTAMGGERPEGRRRGGATPLPLEPSLAALLCAGVAWGGRVASALREVGLSPAGYCVLRSLAKANEPLSLGALADRAAGGSPNITQVIDSLEADGMVDCVDDPGDDRTIRVHLTALGSARQAAGARQLDAVSTEFETAMSGSERAVLGRIASSLV